MFLKEYVDFLTQNKIELIFSKLVTSYMWNKYENVLEKFKCSCNLFVTKVDNNLEITSARSSLDLCNKIWIGPFIDTACHFKTPRLGFSFLPPVSFEII